MVSMINFKVRKAIIPAAGFGTRFLPATKAIPKEMLPIIDIPTIQIIVEECISSGIEELLIIDNDSKLEIKKHFSIDPRLENKLLDANKIEEYELVHNIASKIKIDYIQQNNPLGLGHAISLAEHWVNGEPFLVLCGDDIMVNKNGLPVSKQLIDAYQKCGCSILGVQEVLKENACKYGVIKPIKFDGRLIEIEDVVEKPKIEEIPSNIATLGRYVLNPSIFELLKTQEPGANGEIQLTDSIRRLMKKEKVYAYSFEGIRYDAGDKFGYVTAIIDFALEREDLKEKVLDHLKKKLNCN